MEDPTFVFRNGVRDVRHLGVNPFELDWAYPEAMIGLELDGYGIHLRSADAFDGDRDRRNELVLTGWDIYNFTKRMCRRNPARVVDQVRRALALSKISP